MDGPTPSIHEQLKRLETVVDKSDRRLCGVALIHREVQDPGRMVYSTSLMWNPAKEPLFGEKKVLTPMGEKIEKLRRAKDRWEHHAECFPYGSFLEMMKAIDEIVAE